MSGFIGKLIADKYFWDEGRMGLYYDVCPIHRGSGDQAALQDRLHKLDKELHDGHADEGGWYPTLFLLQSQIDALTEKWCLIFAPKSHLMLFKPGMDLYGLKKCDVKYWRDYNHDAFIWSSKDAVFTQYSPEEMELHFRIANKAEVDAYAASLDGEPDIPNEPDIPVGGQFGSGLFPMNSKTMITWEYFSEFGNKVLPTEITVRPLGKDN